MNPRSYLFCGTRGPSMFIPASSTQDTVGLVLRVMRKLYLSPCHLLRKASSGSWPLVRLSTFLRLHLFYLFPRSRSTPPGLSEMGAEENSGFWSQNFPTLILGQFMFYASRQDFLFDLNLVKQKLVRECSQQHYTQKVETT